VRQTRVPIVAALALAAVLAATAGAQQAKVDVQEFSLDNGMRFLVVERHDAPTVSAGWVAHVGSANERPGITGIAHLFEHMMFKGTSTIGTKDIERERRIIARLDEIRSEMEKEYAKLREAKRRGELEGWIYDPANRTPRLEELWKEMKKLQEEEHRLIVKDEFDKIYTQNGGSGLNAFTNNDMTVYFITVPANKLELWFWMESARLADPVFREFYSERDVVREERRMRVESDPVARFEEQFDAMFWASLPYHHPVVGWPSDVESIGRKQADRFFATYYAPNNLTAAIVGDVDPERVVELARRYFGRIPRGATEPPEVVTEEIEQLAPRRMEAEAETNPMVELRWHTVPFVHRDAYPLQIVAALLNGRTGRLYKALVEEKKLATGEPYAWSRGMKYAGAFEVGAEIAEGHSHREVEDALLAEIERLKTEPVPERELQKVKNQALADSFRRLQSNFYLMVQLLYFDGLGDWRAINEAPGKLLAVTADDVRRVARTYFTPEGLNAMWYRRKAGTEEDPELAALPADARRMAKQLLARLGSVSDPAKLREALEGMRGALSSGQVPEPMRPAVELIVRRLERRLAGLEAAGGKEK